jgi:hypothetical protein
MDCKHYVSEMKCDAFPVKIPKEIWLEGNDHTEPLPDQDNDIVFEPIDND